MSEKDDRLLISWQVFFPTIDKQVSLLDNTVNVKGNKKVLNFYMIQEIYEHPVQLENIISNVEEEPLNVGNTAVISLPEDLSDTIILSTLKQNETIKNI